MIATRIDAVTVFRQGASIQRLAAVDGPGTVVLKGFPLCMLDDIRVAVSGDLDCVDARVELRTPDVEDVQTFDEERAAARARVARAHTAVELLNAELARLRALEFNDAASEDALASADARSRLLDFRRAEVLRVVKERAGARETLHQAQEALADLKARAERSRSRARARTNQLQKVVRVRLEGQGSGTLTVRYSVPGAGWASTLQVRFNAALDQAELRPGVLVRHRTGEDWTDVRLRVTTAEPSSWTELETLHPLRIGRAQPTPASTWRPPPTGTEALFADYDRAFKNRPPPRPKPPPEPEPELDDYMEMEMALDEAGPPPPPPMPAPAAQAPARTVQMAPARMTRKSASVMGAVAGVAAEAADRAFGARGGGGRQKKKRKRAPATVVESHTYRRYADLRMRGPDQSQRGTLQPTSPSTQLLTEARSRARQVQDFPGARNAVTSVDGFDFSWTVPHRVTVPGDGAVHAYALERAQTDATLNLVVVPRQSTDVFRQVELTNRQPWPLLPGPTEVYVDDRYLLTTRMKALRPNQSTVLGLGVEQAVEVVRNATFKESSEGLLVTHLQLHHTVEVKLRSHLDRDVSVEVRERLPQPADDQDDVKVIDKGDWQDWPVDDGGLEGGRRWRVTLPGRAEKTLTATYCIELPGKHELVGGNRREP